MRLYDFTDEVKFLRRLQRDFTKEGMKHRRDGKHQAAVLAEEDAINLTPIIELIESVGKAKRALTVLEKWI